MGTRRWREIKSLFAAFVLAVGIADNVEASNTATLQCRDSFPSQWRGALGLTSRDLVVFSLDLDTYWVKSATVKSYGQSRVMFRGLRISVAEDKLRWVWIDNNTVLESGPTKVIRTYELDRDTLEMKLTVDTGKERVVFQESCFLSRRQL
jgi:hypothetical protein